eukprot:COSAG02_NODE_638_length_19141_cov_20.963449_1_plen_103_part_00
MDVPSAPTKSGNGRLTHPKALGFYFGLHVLTRINTVRLMDLIRHHSITRCMKCMSKGPHSVSKYSKFVIHTAVSAVPRLGCPVSAAQQPGHWRGLIDGVCAR